jgi:hypothetical protein
VLSVLSVPGEHAYSRCKLWNILCHFNNLRKYEIKMIRDRQDRKHTLHLTISNKQNIVRRHSVTRNKCLFCVCSVYCAKCCTCVSTVFSSVYLYTPVVYRKVTFDTVHILQFVNMISLCTTFSTIHRTSTKQTQNRHKTEN